MNTATAARPGSAGLFIGLVGLLATGAYVVWQLMANGHAAYNASSVGLMWGLPIVTYDFFLMSSAGLAIVAALWTVFGWKDFEPIARRALWLALATLVGGVAALFLELGHPLRSLYAIPLNFQVKSPLFWKVIGVSIHGLCLVLLAAGWLSKPASGASAPRGPSLLGVLAAVFVVFTGSLMFATLSMRPFWHAGELPVVFLVEAVLGGLAFALLFTHLAGDRDDATRAATTGTLPRVVALLILVHLLFLVGRAVVGLASNLDGLQVWQKVVASPVFWVQIACLVVALWLTGSTSQRSSGGAQTLAMVLVLVGVFLGKYEFVIAGQVVPLFKGSWVRGLIEYAPSTAEWALLAMSAFLAYAVYAFGASRFRLGQAR